MHLPANWFLPVPLQFFEPPWRRPMYRNPLFKNYNICGGGSAVCCGRQVQEAVLFSRPGHGLARRRRRRRQRDEERRRPRSYSRSNFAFTNIEYFAQVQSIFLCNFKTSEVFCFVSYCFPKIINDLLQFTYLSISNDCCKICLLCHISWMPTHQVVDALQNFFAIIQSTCNRLNKGQQWNRLVAWYPGE